MHPQLSDKKFVCKDFIQALEACHQSGWMARLTGQCNAQKDALNGCLREERKRRTTVNRESAKERGIKREKAMKEFFEDD